MNIKLKDGKTMLIDDEDYKIVKEHVWYSIPGRNTYYARAYIKGKWTQLHRLLMNPLEHEVVDHIDGNGLNNRRSNLRITTRVKNMTYYRVDTHPLRNVHYNKREKKWCVQVRRNRNLNFFGYFDTPEEAIEVRDKFLKEYENKCR